MPQGHFKIFSCDHWCKSRLVKNLLVKNDKINNTQQSTFQNYRLENKLLQELRDELFIIISNTVQPKFSPFIKFIWEGQHQLEFVTNIIQKSTTVYHLHWYKAGIEFLIAASCHSLPHKNKLAAYWWQFLLGIINISGILSHKIRKYTTTNAIYFYWRSSFLCLRNVFKQYFDDWLVSFKLQDGNFF